MDIADRQSARRRGFVVRAWTLGLALLPAVGLATEVHIVAVTPGRSASILIDGAAPLTVEVGETADGVTVVSTDSDGATVRVHGVVQTLPLEIHEPEAAGAIASGSTIKVSADPSGHFLARGAVNGRSVRFLVDTGASLTTLSRAQAKQIGLRYRHGSPARAATANGQVDGWLIELDSVRVGDVTVRNVDAMVINAELSVGLLGMSFLDRFDMEQQGSKLVLRRRR